MAQSSKRSAAKRSGSGQRKRKKNRPGIPAVAIILVLLALLMVLLLLVRMVQGAVNRRTPEPEPTIQTETPAPTLPPTTLVAEAFGEENGFRTYSHEGTTARLGVDVSSHQGGIDWDQVAQAGVDYAIVRVGYRGFGNGSLQEDELAENNILGASAAGLDVGLYVFSQAINPQEAQEEARLAIAYADYYGIQEPIYFDWEPVSAEDARTASISTSELTECALAFCRQVTQAGYEAGVYFNLAMASHYYRLYDLKDYRFWLAEYQFSPSFPYAIDAWQYANDGEVPGIYTVVDMNLSFR